MQHTPEELRGIAQEAAKEVAREAAREAAQQAVRETLLAIGIDASDPLASQRDFATLRQLVAMVSDPDYRKDWEHVRWWREFTENVKMKGVAYATGVVITGLLAALGYGLHDMFLGKH